MAASAKPGNPGSWNRYNYTTGDPVNGHDPRGLDDDDGVMCNDGLIDTYGGNCGAYGGPVEVDGVYASDPCYQIALFFGTAGGCGSGYQDPTAPTIGSIAPPPPCWQDIGNINQTLVDLGANILEIAETKITNPSEISNLTNDIDSTVQGEDQQDLLAFNAPPSFYVGGHFNLDLTVSGLQQALGGDYSLFQSAFGGSVDGTRQAAVYGNAAQGNYTLHSKQYGSQTSGYYGVHFDRYNPLSNIPIGTIQHLFGDVIGGHIGTPCLDPAWQ